MAQLSELDVRSPARDLDLRLDETRPVGAVLNRRYIGPPGRQLHCLEAGASRSGRPLYCMHATAYSGRSFTPLLEALSDDRRVVAIDTPGYGASDAPAAPLDITGYARAIDEALEIAEDGEIDLFGYHTGAIIAAELARLRPDRVARMVLIGVPYFSGQVQAEWRQRLAEPMRLTENLSQFEERWSFFITNRAAGVSLERGFENFVDELRAYPKGWWAHDAAFRFDVERCFMQIRQPTLVINPDNHLSQASRQAALALENGRVLEMPHLNHGIFDVASPEIAAAIQAFLSGADAGSN